MPTVAVVEGVKIQFFPQEHPPPHFHVSLAEHRGQIVIETLSLLNGSLPPAKLKAVISWAEPRKALLAEAWNTVISKRRPEKIL